jgi:hypothetical protein
MLTITWKVDDGYAQNGPHTTTIDDDELEGLTDEEREDVIDEIVQAEFQNNVTWQIVSCDQQ